MSLLVLLSNKHQQYAVETLRFGNKKSDYREINDKRAHNL